MNRATQENIEAARSAGLRELTFYPWENHTIGKILQEEWPEFRATCKNAFILLNGVILYTDLDVDVTYDDYCKFVFGKSPDQIERERMEEAERVEREHRLFRRKIPELYDFYTEAQNAGDVISSEKMDEWKDAVRTMLEGTYGDLCPKSALEIIRWLADGDEFCEIRKKLNVYGHSGGSMIRTLRLVETFGGVRGKSFAEWMKRK